MRGLFLAGLALACAGMPMARAQAPAAQPADVGALMQAAQAQSAGGNHAGAVFTYSQVIALKPDFPIAYASRGMEAFQVGDRNTAIVDLRKALSLGLPGPLAAVATRQLGLTLLMQRQFADAITLYDGYLPANEDWQGYRNRGNAHLELGHEALGLADLDKAIALHPDPSSYVLRAQAMARRQDWPAAETAATEALKLAPGDPAVVRIVAGIRRRGAPLPHLPLAEALAHLRAGAIDFDVAALRSDYAAAPGFSAAGWTETLAAIKALTDGNSAGAAVLIDKRLAAHPLDVQALAMKAEAERKRGDAVKAEAAHDAMVALVQAAMASGDGLTPGSAWQVISVDEEYLLLQVAGLRRAGEQQLIEQGGHRYDKLIATTLEGARTERWFNIDRVFGHEL